MTKKFNLASDILKSNMPSLDGTYQHTKTMSELAKISNPLEDTIKQINAFSLRQDHIFEMLKHANAASQLSKQLASIPNLNDIFSEMNSFSRHATDVSKALEHVRLPAQEAFALAELMSSRVKAFDTIAASQINWTNSLASQIKNINRPWLHPEFSNLSVEGFAVISRMNKVVRSESPFSDRAREIIDKDLGPPIIIDSDADADERDEAHIEAGMNPSIVAINPPAFHDILIETGFHFKAEFMPLPNTEDDSDPGHLFHPGHNMLISSVEQNLRKLISSLLLSHYGSNWLEKSVSATLIKDWQERKDKAIADGEPPFELLQYSNFMELKDIVVSKKNWREVFVIIFKRKEHFIVAMERLHPIRLPLAHSRPIGRAQQFHLINEAAIILKAIGIDIFHN